MSFKRRHFLLLFGLGGVGGALLAHLKEGWTGYPPFVTASPAPPVSPPLSLPDNQLLLRFVALADTGSGDRNQDAVAQAMSRYLARYPYQLAILAGDNIYNQGEIEKVKAVFEQPYAPLLRQGVKFRACLGNHDIRTQNGEPQVHYPGFGMAGRYYTFSEKGVQFFALDTNRNANWSAQLSWLEQELSRSQAPWKIVFGHHPIYSAGFYGVDQALVQRLTPLFQKYGVQLYINGHEHSYERTRSINGTTYLITGIGGASLRQTGRREWTEYATSRFGFSALEVYGDRLVIQAIGTDNQVFDQGIIQRGRV